MIMESGYVMMKSRIHRCNCRKTWSVQNRKRKMNASSILLSGDWTSELKPERKCDPKGFVTTTSSQDIIINPAKQLVEQFEKTTQLIYDKQNIHFNVENGKYLYFAEDGSCYLLRKRGDGSSASA
ncbi:hypothetical protein [Niallia oryzisoli]|uniref:hypothetical protein n=1 Tax=Niallia oryzisoli TaxID=1737571 RepID=UPI0037361D57